MEENFESNDAGENTPPSHWAVISFVCAGLVILAGIFFAVYLSESKDSENRSELLTRVETIARLTDSNSVAGLSGTSADLSSSGYQTLKQSLIDLHSINTDVRFIYYMRANDTKLFFLVDSEHPDSKDYSPPGQIYDQTTPLEFANYQNGVSYTEGPYKDAWGTWVSAYAPVKTADGTMVATLGMDVSAALWHSEIFSIWVSTMIIALLLALMFFALGLYLRRSLIAVSVFKKMNMNLMHEKTKSDKLVARAGLGEWTLVPSTGAISMNEILYDILGMVSGTKMDLEIFKRTLDAEGQEAFSEKLQSAYDKTSREFSVNVRSLSGVNLHLTATIDYGAGTKPIRVNGIAQEIIGA